MCMTTGRPSVYRQLVARRHNGERCAPASSQKSLRSKKPPVALSCACSFARSLVTVEVNTVVYKRAELIGKAASCSKAQRACVLQMPRVARKRRNARGTGGRR